VLSDPKQTNKLDSVGLINVEEKKKSLTKQATDKKSPYFGWPILAIAVAQKQHAMVNLLLKSKHNPWQVNLQNENAIIIAIKQNETKIALQLLEHSSQNLNEISQGKEEQLSSLFYISIKNNNLTIIKALLPLTDYINLARLPINKSPLWHATTLKNSDAFVLLAQKLPLDKREDKEQRTLLLLASELNQDEIILLLIAMEANVNHLNNKRRNALWYAADFKNNRLIGDLLYAKSNVQVADVQGHTALTRAVIKNCIACVTSLLNVGADAQIKTIHANNALMFAAQGKAEVLQVILSFNHQSKLKKPLNIKQRNDQSLTSLMLAVNSHCEQCVTLLLDAGANPKRKNDKGENSFDLAKSKPSILAILNKY